MKCRRAWLAAGALIAVWPTSRALADVPQKINDEGRLYDASTNAAATGSHTLKFAIYSAAQGGTALWFQSSSVMFDDGFFEITLDGSSSATTPFPAGMFNGSELYLGVSVDSDGEMTPREPLDSVPYAIGAAAMVGRQMCPPGYQQDTSITTFVDCKLPLSGGQSDEVVKVGDYWIDRFESSSCLGAAGMPDGAGDTTVACSVSGVAPLENHSWFQAERECLNAGKHLCTNAEWQGAALGTPEPGDSTGGSGTCLTDGAAPRNTGLGSACRSDFGAEDMVGNEWEWVADWGTTGVSDPAFTNAKVATPWPTTYGDGTDETVNLNTSTNQGPNLPQAILRGGDYIDKAHDGVYAIALDDSPTLQYTSVGARCCLSGGY
jgi:hypothetical protein